MTEEIKKPRWAGDPNNVVETYASLFGGGTMWGGVISYTLCATRVRVNFEGDNEIEQIVVARNRLDYDTAVRLRDFLDAQIKFLSAPKGDAN